MLFIKTSSEKSIFKMQNNLFIQSIKLERQSVPDFQQYPFSIPVIQDFSELHFHKPVTFLVGENGAGKSTLIEALAVSIGLNPEGGSQNFNFQTKSTHSILSDYIKVARCGRPTTKYFLRAESFYNVASEIIRLSEECGAGPLYSAYGGNLHECSHGESFIKLVQNRFYPRGLYILDEPEAALSPERQMTLLCLIHDLAQNGAQFIIASHSPILISYVHGEIIDLSDNLKPVKYEDTSIYQTYKTYLDNPTAMQRHLFQV